MPLAATTRVGDAVAVDLRLADTFANPVLGAADATVTLASPASLPLTLSGANFTALGSGTFRHVLTLSSQGRLNATLAVAGVRVPPPGGAASLSVASVAASAVAWSASLAASSLALRSGSRGASSVVPLQAYAGRAVPCLAGATHRVLVPPLRLNGVPFGADPGLLPGLAVAGRGLNGSLMTLSYNGSWSPANHSYVVFVRLPEPGTYEATLQLRHPTEPAQVTDVNAPAGSAGIGLSVQCLELTLILPCAFSQASLPIQMQAVPPPHAESASLSAAVAASALTPPTSAFSSTGAMSRAGEWVVVNVSLADAEGNPAWTADGAQLAASGSVSGNVSLSLAAAAPESGQWSSR